MPDMREREEKIIDAAVRVFSRYGVKRTSMNDIASEAGIARQTLYNAFANKDDVLCAAIRVFADRSMADIQAKLDDIPALGARLDLVFEHLAIVPYDMLSASPNAEGIFDGFNAAGMAEMAESHQRFRQVIEDILEPHAAALAQAGLTPASLSDFVRKSATSAKHDARNRDHLIELLTTLKALVVNVAR